jgi:hypothetical protein
VDCQLPANLVQDGVVVQPVLHLLQEGWDALLVHLQRANCRDALRKKFLEHSLGGVQPESNESFNSEVTSGHGHWLKILGL